VRLNIPAGAARAAGWASRDRFPALTAAPQAQAAVSALYVIGVNFSIGGGSVAGGQVLDRLGMASLPLLAAVPAAAAWFIVVRARRHAFPRRPIASAGARPERDSGDSVPREADEASLIARPSADIGRAGAASPSCPERSTTVRCD
jgi:hypothetical protein